MRVQEKFNEGLSKEVRWPVDMRALDDPHVKTNLLLQVHAESKSQSGIPWYLINLGHNYILLQNV